MNDYNTALNESDTKFIYEGCTQMIPSIKHAKIIDEMVGLRPGRSYVRLEQDTYTTRKIKYMHTYPINPSLTEINIHSLRQVIENVCE